MKSQRVLMVANREMLMAFLQANYPDTKRTALKQLLRHRAVFVNGNPVTRPNHMLEAGDRVVVERGQPEPERKKVKGIMPEIVFEDRHIIVVDKPEGLLTIATDKETFRTAYRQITSYVQEDRPHRGERIFIVHRLDRETSGLLVFARTEEAKQTLQENWEDADKKYYAVVEGVPHVREGKIRSHLRENPKSLKVHSGPPTADAKLAVTKYRVIEESRHFALLDVTLETGRKNQIRAHLTELGHPVVGDKKYDATSNPIRRLALHAYYLSFPHPITGKRLTFKTEVPDDFKALLEEKKGPILRSVANRGERQQSRHVVEPLTKGDEKRSRREDRFPRTDRRGGQFGRRGPEQRFKREEGRSFEDFGFDGFDEGEEQEFAPKREHPGSRRSISRDFEQSGRGSGRRDDRVQRPRRDIPKQFRGKRADGLPRPDERPRERGRREPDTFEDRGPREERRPRREQDDKPRQFDRKPGRGDFRGRGGEGRPRRDDRPRERDNSEGRGPREERRPRREQDDKPRQFDRKPRRGDFRGRGGEGRPRRDDRPHERERGGSDGFEERAPRGEHEPRRSGEGRPGQFDRKPQGRHGGGAKRPSQRPGGQRGGKPPRRGR